MKYRLALVLLLQLGWLPAAENPGGSTPDPAAALNALLARFLDGASRNDINIHERFWADDLIYTSSSGKRYHKKEILADVTKENQTADRTLDTRYAAEQVHVQEYFGTTAIVTFELVATITKQGKTETARYLNTGTFICRNNIWQAVAWQATKKTGG
jgi:hypothetical protein